ncbi:DUF5658 family protein [Cytobacillus dafuensis]|uniref:DUF5658 domain-containing protein n=1 Tax=Cytobacillus dafuensis TaxID=1742359 RepID=A0A5B8Z1S2_CYTDA|nr:DUF5658 family protein [Cytobacillus dafuensis]QED46791.1 hypothetical protein FSZ17_05590 [Cytobacillus dafuensis]
MKKVFSYLALLNLFDGAFTFFGLHFSLIEESNPFMDALYKYNPLCFLAYKIILSCILFAFIILKKMPLSNSIKYLAVGASLLYTFVCLYHGVWILQIFQF